MSELAFLLFVLVFLLVVFAIWAVIGHLLWEMTVWTIRHLMKADQQSPPTIQPDWECLNCNFVHRHTQILCSSCGIARPTAADLEQLKDLAATKRQLIRFRDSNKIEFGDFEKLQIALDEARQELIGRKKRNTEKHVHAETTATSSRVPPVIVATTTINEPPLVPISDVAKPKPIIVAARPQRRSFSEVLNTFMEQSNIRWGEIIGGILIIGCSTALTVSLWAEISRIPVLKFLIFTTVTAVLFGIGLYTEHRWKLPTTSRGILTIATLLVPLNFLAIAAVSSSAATGALIIGSELLAPAIFLCLVYFAGRVITPGCAGVLSAGILGSSVGQLFVRHFVSGESSPAVLVLAGAFPVLCYITTIGLALRKVLADREIDEHEPGVVFTMLGTMSFAALLPFGLLLYKAGPIGMSMMYLAPIVTLWGLPMLTTGTVLWRLITERGLAAERTAGTALAILGTLIVLSGMILAWPNPASIVPTALINFAVFVALAFILELPAAHLIAATCFALAYLVLFHVGAGHSPWLNLRVMSLLEVTLSAVSGQALAAAVLVFLGFSDWLSRRGKTPHSHYNLVAGCGLAVISLSFLAAFGVWFEDPFIWPVLALYMFAAFWIAVRRQVQAFGWIASAFLLLSIAQGLSESQLVEFEWQTALFIHATICSVVALVNNRYQLTRMLSQVFSISALLSSSVVIALMFQSNPWQTTASQSAHVFWLSAIWLSLLWLHRSRLLFTAFQIAVTAGVVIGVKATLQRLEWCDYLPHAFLHPWALQIQGLALVLLSLAWATLRLRLKETVIIHSRFAFDRVLLWLLLPAFGLFVTYGALSGLAREIFALPIDHAGINIANFPHEEVLGVGSWTILALLVLTILVTFWERRTAKYFVGAVAVACGALPLLAAHFEPDIATGSAMRWFGAIFFLIGVLATAYRNRLNSFVTGFGWPQVQSSSTTVSSSIVLLIFALCVVPVITLTAFQTLHGIDARPLTGLFSVLDASFSHAAPLVIVAIALLTFAVRERNISSALVAGCFFNAAASVAYLLSADRTQGILDPVIVIRTIQLNAIVGSVYGILCLLKRSWSNRFDVAGVLKVQTFAALVLNAVLIVPLTLAVLFGISIGIKGQVAGDFVGFTSLSATIAALSLLLRAQKKRVSSAHVSIVLLAICALLSVSTSNSLQILAVGSGLISWLMLVLGERANSERIVDSSWKQQCRIGAAALAGCSALLGLRLLVEPDVNRWWSVLPVLAASALFVLLNWWTLRRKYLYVAGLLLNIAVTIWGDRIIDITLASLVEVNIIALSLSSVCWLFLELRARNSGRTSQPAFSIHNVGAIGSLIALTYLVVATFVLAMDGLTFNPNPSLIWVAFGSTLLLLVATLWDRYARYSISAMYLLGLLACALSFHQLDLPYTRIAWSSAMVLSIFALGSNLLWRSRQKLYDLGHRVGIPQRISFETTELDWLVVFNGVAVAVVVGIVYWIELRFVDFSLRTTAALALLTHSLTFGIIAHGKWRGHWQKASIAMFVMGAIFMGWSLLTPGVNATWLNRSVIVMVETLAITAVYGWGLSTLKARASEWANAAKSCMPPIIGMGAIALMFCLATEVFYQIAFGAVRIHTISLFAIGLTLASSIVIGFLFSLSPDHDPLNLPEHGRMKYVYAAEVMMALLFLHIRLTMPWLFTGFFEQYWPVVVMSIAYLGVLASEALRRRNLLTVAQPLERTGAFLPLLPVVGFWLAQSEIDYSLLLFIVGGLYGLLSILRRSIACGVLAAVAGNGGLWYMLHRTADYGFFQHPQLWLIPVALSVLVAAYLNEDRLNDDQMTGLRYLSLVTVYASSTADIFINGVENSPWLPLILGGFALAGVFSGIIFRIRGLLLLGSVFLLLSIVTMIWYASANMGWTWLWYVAGIVTGATIIFMFAMFEKKRTEVLRVVEGFREWER